MDWMAYVVAGLIVWTALIPFAVVGVRLLRANATASSAAASLPLRNMPAQTCAGRNRPRAQTGL
jgi:hypothetical protein